MFPVVTSGTDIFAVLNVFTTYFELMSESIRDITVKFAGYVDYSMRVGPIKFYFSGAISWSSTRHEIWVRNLFFFLSLFSVGRISSR